MSAADIPLRHRRLRAPREDGTALIDPPVAEAVKLVAANRALAQTWDEATGLRFARWRNEARGSLLFATTLGGERPWAAKQELGRLSRPIVMTGHQPSLFHPGVWLKNFLADRIAKEVEGTAVNLLVDNDTVRHAGIRVPTGYRESPHLTEVPLDAPASEMPWEERSILDPKIFQSFAGRVRKAFDSLGPWASKRSLLIDSIWPHAVGQALQPCDPALAGTGFENWNRSLGRCLAKARHVFERSLGLESLETPISRFCQMGCMRDFIEHLLGRWKELHPIYNASLREYRTVNYIRSRNHPAPDLATEGEWLECPLWIWDRLNPQRRRAFVRRTPNGWELTDRSAVRMRGNEPRSDVKIRPRALITTMFARLILSDLFIHGIGGAKYDELTDALIRRFFGIEPPAYVTATATFRLPIERPQVTEDDLHHIERRLRDTLHHPETFVSEVASGHENELLQLAARKKELIAAGWIEKQKKAWHNQVADCNDRMTALLDGVRQRLLHERTELLAKLHTADLLGSREFSFVLFPEETLPPALLDLCAAKP